MEYEGHGNQKGGEHETTDPRRPAQQQRTTRQHLDGYGEYQKKVTAGRPADCM